MPKCSNQYEVASTKLWLALTELASLLQKPRHAGLLPYFVNWNTRSQEGWKNVVIDSDSVVWRCVGFFFLYVFCMVSMVTVGMAGGNTTCLQILNSQHNRIQICDLTLKRLFVFFAHCPSIFLQWLLFSPYLSSCFLITVWMQDKDHVQQFQNISF